MKRLLPLVLTLAAAPAHAWLGRGHEQIADIAWTQLSDGAKKEIAAILKAGDAPFQPAGDSEKDVRAAFRSAATWADWIKEHKDGIYEPEIKVWNARFQPGHQEDDTDRESHRCKRWHYFDVPIDFQGATPGVEGSNALIALTSARYEFAILGRQDPKDRKTQCWWLYWITHVVGDLHQPLHCVSSYKFDPRGDAGGNFFKLGIGYPDNPDRMANLHFFWDQGIENAIAADKAKGESDSIEDVSQRWSKTAGPVSTDVENMEFATWIAAGAKNAQGLVYTGVDKDGKPSDAYRAKQADFCRKAATLAGYRLAREIELGLGTKS
ncbi:MAG: S1/P1 nuclease [Armatimonadetes bacterium]|nr:S1/P1 nuclease [Armatimonadota bacterium]